MAMTLTEVRRAVGLKLGDVLILRATDDAPSTSTFTDAVHFGNREDNAPSLTNRILYFATGDNAGHEARTTTYASATTTLSFTPAATANPATGEEAELWSVTERIQSITNLHAYINLAIRSVERIATSEVWAPAETFNARSPYLDIPANWVEVGGVEYTDRSGYVYEVPESLLRVRPGPRTIQILGRPAAFAHSRSATVWGYAKASQLVADTDTTDVDPQWLIETVASAISLAGSWRASELRGPSEERRASFWAQREQMYRANLATGHRGLGISL